MGLFGSLFTGVSALFAQSQNTAIISNNIANVNTTGFKRSEASFDSLVTTQSRSSLFSPGTVSVNRIQRVDQQGSIQQTSSSTDAAISGNGFFPVKRSTDFGQEFLYTRAGQFSEDSQGLLRNASGFVLYAWPIDANGDLPANQGDLTSLVPADVAFLGGLTRPTTSAELAINLDANEVDIVNTTLPVPSTTQADFSRGLTVFDSLGSPQTITFEYRKIVGPMASVSTSTAQSLSSDDEIAGAGALDGVLEGISAGDTFSIQVGDSTAEVIEILDETGDSLSAGSDVGVATVQELIDALNAYGTGNEIEARLVSGQIRIQVTDPSETLRITDVNNTPAFGGSNTLNFVTDAQGNDEATTGQFSAAQIATPTTTALSSLADVTNGDPITFNVDGTAFGPLTVVAGPAANNGEIATIQDLLDAVNGDTSATTGVAYTGVTGLSASISDDGRIIYTLDDPTDSFVVSGAAATGTDSLGVSFAGSEIYEPQAPLTPGTNGSYGQNTPYSSQGDFPAFEDTTSPNTQGWWEITVLDPDGNQLTQGLVNFAGDGSLNAQADANGNVDINLSNINWFNGSELQDIDVDVSRFSQFSGNYDVIFSDQNGAELGLRTGVEITREGVVVARFSNGASADLYKIPLTTFANANGLTEVSGTAYTEGEESGEENLREAGQGGAGFVEPSTLEASNVDLADEFARLIVAQRAFSAGTRIISSVDESTQELLRIV